MFYVYVLQSRRDKSNYVGITKNIQKRLLEHNTGSAKYSSSKGPFILVWFCCFREEVKARLFEKYLKQGSGHAFARKHLL